MFRLARELGMTKSRLLQEMDSRELSEWVAYFKVESTLDKKQDSAETLKAKFQSLVPPKKNAKRKSNN